MKRRQIINLINFAVILLIVPAVFALIGLISPQNTSYTNGNNDTISFTFNYNGSIGADVNCTLTIDSVSSGTNVSTDVGVSTIIKANHSLAEGTRTWNVTCSNSTGGSEKSNATFTLIVDRTAPVITEVQDLLLTNSSVVINWTTDELANSSINYGTTTSLGTYILNATFMLSHHQNITGLINGTLYYYNVTSCDQAGNCNISLGSYTFTVLQNDAPAAVILPTGGHKCTRSLALSLPNSLDFGKSATASLPVNFTNDGTCTIYRATAYLEYGANNISVGSIGTLFEEESKLAYVTISSKGYSNQERVPINIFVDAVDYSNKYSFVVKFIKNEVQLQAEETSVSEQTPLNQVESQLADSRAASAEEQISLPSDVQIIVGALFVILIIVGLLMFFLKNK